MKLKEILLEAEEKSYTLEQLKELYRKYKFAAVYYHSGYQYDCEVAVLMDVPANISNQEKQKLFTRMFGNDDNAMRTAEDSWTVISNVNDIPNLDPARISRMSTGAQEQENDLYKVYCMSFVDWAYDMINADIDGDSNDFEDE